SSASAVRSSKIAGALTKLPSVYPDRALHETRPKSRPHELALPLLTSYNRVLTLLLSLPRSPERLPPADRDPGAASWRNAPYFAQMEGFGSRGRILASGIGLALRRPGQQLCETRFEVVRKLY